MRESIGNSLLLNLVIIFSGIVILFFIGIISYSKAYRVKNRIIDVIEKYDGYTTGAIDEINKSLSEAGYSLSTKNCNGAQRHLNEIISKKNEAGEEVPLNIGQLNSSEYNYCIYEISGKSSDSSKYYMVATFVHFDFPVIGDFINIPVYGETKILGKTYDY